MLGHLTRWLLAGALLAMVSACQTVPAQPRMTLEEVVKMSQAGSSAGEIINALEERRIYLGFTGSQLARLKEQGVADEVLDYLLREQNRSARQYGYLSHEPLWWYYPPYYYHRRHDGVVVVEPPRR